MAHLPPKVPPMTQNWPSFPYQTLSICNPNATTTTTTTTTSINSPTMSENHRPLWVDEFLDFTSVRRGSHRRSISDPIAFLETPLFLEEPHSQTTTTITSNINNNTNSFISHHNNPSNATISMATEGLNFDRLDEEQLMLIFSDDMSLALLPTSPNPSTPSSDHNSNNEEKPTVLLNLHCPVVKPPSTPPPPPPPQQQQPRHPQSQNPMAKEESGELESLCKQEPQDTEPQPPSSFNGDLVIDPKRVKRILANRQSAQRSRVRKLQYISELERSVTTLQTEVSALSPRVAFLDHQRLLLTVDNSALKQRIAALGQDKIFKDAYQEELKKEVERLSEVYHQQILENMNNGSDHNPNNSNAMQCTEKEQPLMG